MSGEPTVQAVYQPFPFEVPHVSLDVSIQPGTTQVTSTVQYVPQQAGPKCSTSQELHLRGEDIELVKLSLDGECQGERYSHNVRCYSQ